MEQWEQRRHVIEHQRFVQGIAPAVAMQNEYCAEQPTVKDHTVGYRLIKLGEMGFQVCGVPDENRGDREQVQ